MYKDFDLEKVYDLVFNSNISGWEIEKSVGFNRSTMARLRSGKTSFEKLTLQNLLKLKEFSDKK